MTEQQIRSAFEEKVRRGIFRPISRHISRASDIEERLSEGIALTYELYARHARQGVFLDDALLVHHCRLRAADPGRHLVRGEHSALDVLDPRPYLTGQVEVVHVDGLPDQDGDFQGEEDGTVVVGLAEGLAQDPTPRIIAAIDLARWAATLSVRDRALLIARYEGRTLSEAAAATGSSTSCAFAQLRRLGQELAARAGVTIARKPRKERVRARAGQGQPCPA
jgi:hypothetical protein